MSTPQVTVLMAVYNGETYLKEAIDSIVCQTFSDFEFLIIDDASTDRTREVIASYNDPRIVLHCNETNLGLTKSLNKGLRLARGAYIARMDADDVSMPTRLAQQIRFLEKHPSVGVCVSNYSFFPTGYVAQLPATFQELKVRFLKENPVAHASVMFRKQLIAQHQLMYDESFRSAQDYHLWVRMAEKTTFGIIPQQLVQIRVHPQQISQSSQVQQTANAQRAQRYLLGALLGNALTEQDAALLPLLWGSAPQTHALSVLFLIHKMWRHNRKKQLFEEKHLERLLKRPWQVAFSNISDFNRSLLFILWQTPFFLQLPLQQKIAISLRCLRS